MFSGVRVSQDPYGSGLLLLGDVMNNTGTAQELKGLTGTFYNDQGQVMADGNTADYWPIAAVPQGGQLPFELIALGLDSAADFDLRVEAEPGNELLRQDFEFLDVTPSSEGGDYCLRGRVHNPGGGLESYLIVVTVLYDQQDNVINYSDDYKTVPAELGGGQTIDFEVCVDPLGQDVARYDLRAWGE
jgi:hypothetical protein